MRVGGAVKIRSGCCSCRFSHACLHFHSSYVHSWRFKCRRRETAGTSIGDRRNQLITCKRGSIVCICRLAMSGAAGRGWVQLSTEVRTCLCMKSSALERATASARDTQSAQKKAKFRSKKHSRKTQHKARQHADWLEAMRPRWRDIV